MKILQIHRFFNIIGGAERYFFDVSKLLKKHGHEIAFFSMHDKNNFNSGWNQYFVSNVSFEDKSIQSRLRLVERFIYSRESKDKIGRLLNDNRLDIAHIHDLNYFISPSILPVIHNAGIPIIQTIHDYLKIAPSWNLFHDGQICEITKKRKFFRAIFHRCVSSSVKFNTLFIVAKYIHNILGLENIVDYYISPSMFINKKLIEYDIPAEKIIYVPYFVDYFQYEPNYESGNYILYFGRLSPEKGLKNLIRAMQYLPKIKLIIAGRGEEDTDLKSFVGSLKLKNVRFSGFYDGSRLRNLIAGCRFTVLPSIWYEVFGISILESFACGKPVIASNIGGIPEIIEDGFNGLLFEPGNIDNLVDNIDKLWNNTPLCKSLGKNAREHVIKYYGPEEHYEKMIEIYKKAIKIHKI